MSDSKYRPPSGSQLSIEEKAELWDRLMSCDRIRVLGYARGGADGKQGPINHISLELWATFAPAKSVELNTGIGRDLLTEFARGVENTSIPVTKDTTTRHQTITDALEECLAVLSEPRFSNRKNLATQKARTALAIAHNLKA